MPGPYAMLVWRRSWGQQRPAPRPIAMMNLLEIMAERGEREWPREAMAAGWSATRTGLGCPILAPALFHLFPIFFFFLFLAFSTPPTTDGSGRQEERRETEEEKIY